MPNWYHYRQNNSGGTWVFDADRGISANVYIEAPTPRVADARAEDIGLYFDGWNDCSCCGDRWSSADDWNLTPENEIPVKDSPYVADASYGLRWMRGKGPESYVHPLEGDFYASEV